MSEEVAMRAVDDAANLLRLAQDAPDDHSRLLLLQGCVEALSDALIVYCGVLRWTRLFVASLTRSRATRKGWLDMCGSERPDRAHAP